MTRRTRDRERPCPAPTRRDKDNPMNPFDTASPLDARYYLPDPDFFAKLKQYVSEGAQVRYLAQVEAALAEQLAELGLCPRVDAEAIVQACKEVTTEEVYQEEQRIQHNIRALVNCIRRRIP